MTKPQTNPKTIKDLNQKKLKEQEQTNSVYVEYINPNEAKKLQPKNYGLIKGETETVAYSQIHQYYNLEPL